MNTQLKFAIGIVILLISIFAIGLYAERAPLRTMKRIVTQVKSNDINGLAENLDLVSIRTRLQNRMDGDMEDALSTHGDPQNRTAMLEFLHPIFLHRSESLATPAAVLNDLGHLFYEMSNVTMEYLDINSVLINWQSKGTDITMLLQRYGFRWKIAELLFPDSIPRWWEQPTILQGQLYRSSFTDIEHGQEVRTTYTGLLLVDAIDVLNGYGDESDELGPSLVTHLNRVWLNAPDTMLKNIKNGTSITADCKTLIYGNTAHYPLPAECELIATSTIEAVR